MLDTNFSITNQVPPRTQPQRTKPKNRKPKKVKNTFRESIKNLIRDLREIRRNKSVPCLLGEGYTIAIKGTISTISRQGSGFNFSGTWNRGVSYWNQETAIKGAEQLRPHLPFEIEVIHHNDIRDRHEASAINILPTVLKLRNS
jgi:hypothetical protein